MGKMQNDLRVTGTSALCGGLLFTLAATGSAPAQGQQGADQEERVVEEVVVVGSRIRRSSAESDTSAFPVQYLTRERLDMTPADSIADFLQQMPVATGFGRTAANDEYAGGRSSINLRGLGQQYTLVLVDGRRLGGENVPDIGAIPPEAVEGVEVLKTGASAIYGSDAVAGVVNVRLRDDFQGFQMHGSYGEATLGGGEITRLSSLFGYADGPFSFTGSLAYQEDDGFLKFEREITENQDLRPFGGIDRRSGFMTEPHMFQLANGEQYTIDTSRFSPGDAVTSLDDVVPKADAQKMSGQEQDKLPAQDRWSAHWAADYEIMENRLRFYTRGYADTRNRQFIIHPAIAVVDVAADSPNNPFGEDVTAFYLWSSSLGTPRSQLMNIRSDTWNTQGTFGFDGAFNERFTWDLGYTYFREHADVQQRNDIAVSRAQAAADSGEFNPFCWYCNGDDVFELVSADTAIERLNVLRTIDFTVSGDLLEWSQGMIQIAAGYQHRDVEFEIRPDEAARTFNFWWNGAALTEERGKRNVDAAFVELNVPLYDGAADSFVQSAEMSGAVRVESYSDFGSSTVWQTLAKVGMVEDQLIVRAGYAKTFRAPSVEALTEPVNTGRAGGQTIFDPTTGQIVSEIDIVSGGNPDLEREIGNTYNLGVIIRPNQIENLFLTIDYWDTEITDVIRAPDIDGLFQGVETAGSIDRNTPSGVPLVDVRPDNGGELEAEGVDVNATYSLATEYGHFNFFVNGTRLIEFEERAAGQTVVHLDEFSQTFDAIPEWRVVSGVNWARGPVDAALTFNYTSGVRDNLVGTGIDRRADSYDTVDLQVGYDFPGFGELESVRAYFGADNLLNHKPIFVAEVFDGALETSPNTLVGRYVYGGVKVRF